MIPGYGASKLREEVVASAATIEVNADLVRLSGSTQINTINSKLMLNRGGLLIFLVATDGAITLGTSGNILVGQSLAQNRLYTLAYSSAAAKWYIHGVV